MSDLPASLPSWRIDAAALHAALAGPARGWAVELVDETGSTNADLVQACRTAAWTEAAMVRLTYRQTAGRGRLGRPWQGQAGLTFSAALPLPVPAPRLAGLSLAVGLAVAEALDDCAVGVHVGGAGATDTRPATAGARDAVPAAPAAPAAAPGARVRLKWPNDLQLDGRKLAGILIEAVPAGPGRVWAVVGIGLNLVRDAAMEAALGRTLAGAGELFAGGFDMRRDPTRILAAILNRLAAMREIFVAEGFAPMAARWSARDAYRDEPVRLLQDGALLAEGLARGVDGDGHLLLETDAGLQTIASGELSLRGAAA